MLLFSQSLSCEKSKYKQRCRKAKCRCRPASQTHTVLTNSTQRSAVEMKTKGSIITNQSLTHTHKGAYLEVTSAAIRKHADNQERKATTESVSWWWYHDEFMTWWRSASDWTQRGDMKEPWHTNYILKRSRTHIWIQSHWKFIPT